MSRAPLPLGTWGKIRTYVIAIGSRGRTTRARAIAKYRDYDGVTRQVEAYGPTKAKAENRLRNKLKERTAASRQGQLTGQDRFAKAADMHMDRLRELAKEGRRSPGTIE